MTEAELQIKVADYLHDNYEGVLFKPDYGSGVRLTPRQAVMQKRQSGGIRGWPDLFIAEPVTKDILTDPDYKRHLILTYYGLFIELKREGVRLKKKNGEWASPHIKEQAEILERLRKKGYEAYFACGFEEAKYRIDNYLKYMEDI